MNYRLFSALIAFGVSITAYLALWLIETLTGWSIHPGAIAAVSFVFLLAVFNQPVKQG